MTVKEPRYRTLLWALTLVLLITLMSLVYRSSLKQIVLISCSTEDSVQMDMFSPFQCLDTKEASRYMSNTYKKAVKFIFSAQFSRRPATYLKLTSPRKWYRRLSQIAAIIKVPEVDCRAIFSGSIKDISLAKIKRKNMGIPLCDKMYADLTSNCRRFKKHRGYILSALTKLENDFPLAFALMVQEDAEMVERVLRSVYRPQNFYCIHVDLKSTDDFFKAVSEIAKCFDNVFVASKRINAQRGNVLEPKPELLCMAELLKFPGWKYFLTLTGQDFPLKSNLELVKVLGSYREVNDNATNSKSVRETNWKDTDVHQGVGPALGSAHITVSRATVEFVLLNNNAKEILSWSNISEVTDSILFDSLKNNSLLEVNDINTGQLEQNGMSHFLTRYAKWVNIPCGDSFISEICILTASDLPMLGKAKQMFANKFQLSEDRVVVGCLEEKIFNDTRDEYAGI